MVEIIQKLAKKRNISFRQLEIELQLSNGTIRTWDRKAPSYDKILKIAQYFNVSMEYIITGKNGNYTQEEIELINKFRESDQRGKATIISIADMEARRSRAAAEGSEGSDQRDELKPFA